MSTNAEPRLTQLLNRMWQGDRHAADQAADLIYRQLQRIASNHLRRERRDHTLETNALVHEAYLKLTGSRGMVIQNRAHFYAVASQQMRRILVDHGRAMQAQRRGGGALKVTLDKVRFGADPLNLDLLQLDEALRELELLDARAARVVELRYFGGYSDKELTEALDISLATVRRDWAFARSWLFERLGSNKPA